MGNSEGQYKMTDQERRSASSAFDRSQNKVLTEQGLDIFLIKNFEDIKLTALAAYDVLMVDYYNPTRVNELLNDIRSSAYEEIYLKPVFLLVYDREVHPIDIALSDGNLEEPSIDTHFSHLEQILKRTDEVLKITSDFKGRKILLKLLRFLYTRGSTLKPIPEKNSLLGYSFPFLDANIKEYDYQEVLDLLEAGVDRGFIEPDFVDVAHLCSNCLSGFINYRETCPKCGSRKHESQHTIHHFVCGYVGPESDYKEHDRLVCPKCDRQLRHIGVDYDKPSLVSECDNGHIFQEAVMKTFCFNCHQEEELGSLIDYVINDYTLTASGADAAISGTTKKKKEVEELEGYVSLSVFKTFLKVEIQRQKALNKTSNITYMNLLMSPGTLKQHQDDYEGFSADVARIFKDQLKATEIVSFLNDDIFLIMTPEATVEETKERFLEIKKHLLHYIKNNLEGNEDDNIVVETFDLDLDSEADSILNNINQKVKIF